MPIPPEPKIYSCISCAWSQRTNPLSDCLLPGDHFEHCPKYGSSVEASVDKATILTNKFKRLIGLKI